jgi:hypothetical protein
MITYYIRFDLHKVLSQIPADADSLNWPQDGFISHDEFSGPKHDEL